MDVAAEAGSSLLVEPRLMTEEDLPWVYTLCKKKYPYDYDWVTCEGWYRNIMLKQPMVYLPVRMPNAFCIAMMSILPWFPSDLECNVVFIVADDGCMWEAMKCLRASIEWGRRRKAKLWRLSSDTDYDLRGMALRLGAKEISPRYELRY